LFAYKNVRLVSFNLESRGFLDNLIRPNIYRTRLTSMREHKSLVLGLIISSKVSSFRDSKLLAECLFMYDVCLLFYAIGGGWLFSLFICSLYYMHHLCQKQHRKNVSYCCLSCLPCLTDFIIDVLKRHFGITV